MKEQEIEKMLTIISVANTMGNPYVDQKIAEALYDAGYRNVKNMKVLTCEKLTDVLKNKLTLEEFRSLSEYPNQEAIGRALTFGLFAQLNADRGLNEEETGWCPQHGYPLPCAKCGYSKPPVDLREAIARIICCFSKENKTCSECKENTPKTPFPDCFEDIRNYTDQILSLIQPLIQQARQEEKEGEENG